MIVLKDDSSPVLHVVCQNYLGCSSQLMEQLIVARNEMEKNMNSRLQILSVIPIEVLCGMISHIKNSTFMEYLTIVLAFKWLLQ